MPDGTLLAQGREAEVYLLPDGRVLKLLRPAIDQARADREAEVCRTLAAAGVAAPIAHGAVTVEGRRGVLMDRLEGLDLLTALGRAPHKVLRAAQVLAEAQLAIHEVRAPDGLPDVRDDLRARIATAEALPDDLRALALSVLDGLPGGDRLLHSDLHLGNLVGTWDAPVAIDWTSAAAGDPLADVARTDMLQRFGVVPPGTARSLRVLATVGRRLLVDRYVARYGAHRPLGETYPRWRLVSWAARFREPIPEEHVILLPHLRRMAATLER